MSRSVAIVSIIKDILCRENIADITQLCLRVRELGYQVSTTRIRMAYDIIQKQTVSVSTIETLVQIITT